MKTSPPNVTVFLFLLVIGTVSAFAAEDAAIEAETLPFLSPVKIWDAGGHNAFTDILRFKDHFYVTFREGTGHVPEKTTGVGDGTVRILRSDSGEKWESVALLKRDGFDLRDAKLSVTTDGRLLVTMGGSVYVEGKLTKRVPQYSFSDVAGEKFTDPADAVIDESIRSNFDWLWRVTWKEGTGYGVVYQYSEEPEWNVWLVKTTDGVHYEKVVKLDVEGRPNEATVRFEGDENGQSGAMRILVRRESGNSHGFLGRSKAPFTDWVWRDTGESLGGPNMIYLPDGTLFGGGRVKGRTGLGVFEKDGGYRNLVTLPSSGDNSYPGFCLVDDTLWVTYYSSHEGKTSIFLTKILLQDVKNAIGKKEIGKNLALGKSYSLAPKPAYSYCSDEGDKTQLTDGQTTDQYFWTQKGTVGWSGAAWASIIIDLGKIEPIDAVSFTTAAGVAGVDWPALASCLASEDGKTWFEVGDLMTLDMEQNGPLDLTKYNIRKITARGLATKGRFVQLFIRPRGPFFFTDEIEVLRGEESLLAKPYSGAPIESVEKMTEKLQFTILVNRRFYDDVGRIAADLSKRFNAETDKTRQAEFGRLRDELRGVAIDRAWVESIDPKTFRAILPYGQAHEKIFAAQGAGWRLALAGAGKPDVDFLVEAAPFYDLLAPTDAPRTLTESKDAKDDGVATLNGANSILLAQNQRRSLAWNLYNLTGRPLDLTVSLGGPLAKKPSAIRLYDLPWTDTAQGIPVVAALLPAKKTDDAVFSVRVLPGLAKQIALEVDTKTLDAGDYSGCLRFRADGVTISDAPFSVRVAPVRLPERRTLLLGGWDYVNNGGNYNVTKTNIDSFVALLKANGVNAPWANPSVIFSGQKIEKGTDGRPAVTIETSAMDEWLGRWEDATEYFIFLSVPENLGPYRFDAPDFEEAAALWAKKWGDYFTSKKIDPSRVSFLVRDEPGLSHERDTASLFAWAKGIKKGESRFNIWEDPVFVPPTELPTEFVKSCDVLCPNRPQWLQNREAFEKVYRDARSKDVRLDLYSCSGPVRLLDPYNYFRLQAWHLFAERGTASFFWAMGDGSGVSSWNEYLLSRNGFTPLYIDPNDSVVTSAKQLDAMRVSSDDFELLTLFRRFAEEGKAAGKDVSLAEKILSEGIQNVLWAEGNDKISWTFPKNRTAADRLREEILAILSEK